MILFQLELEDPKQRKVKLGSVMLGQKVKKHVVVVNRSTLDLSFTMVLNTNTPLDLKVCSTHTTVVNLSSHTGNIYILSSTVLCSVPSGSDIQSSR